VAAPLRRVSKNYSNSALRKRVFDAVVNGKGRGGRKVQQAVNPYGKSPYPTRNIGSPVKVPAEVRAHGWGLYSKVRGAIGVKSIPGEFIEQALDARSKIEYEKEWSTTTKKKMSAEAKKAAQVTTQLRMAEWKEDITRNITNANAKNGKIVANDVISRLRKQKEVILADLGTGAGMTIAPVIRNLSREQRQRVKIFLVDVSEKDLKNAKQMLAGMNVPEKNITICATDFNNMLHNKAIQSIAGKADVITSGAALHHISRSQKIFSQVEKLLKKGGSFKFWDWSHPAWRAETLLVAPKGAKVSANGLACVIEGRLIRASRGAAFISQEAGKYPNQRSELAQTKEMLSTWISLLNFSQEERTKYEQYFDSLITEGKPIRFADYLKRLESVAPSSVAKPQVMEAHKTYQNYMRALNGVGLKAQVPVFSPDSGLLVHYSATKK
jgi:SAM-dependent methyltransferase